MNETRVRVRYAETDQMGVVYYANYFVWMEVGRAELCRSLGIAYREIEAQDGILLTVAEATCRYHYPARYDQEVVVRTTIAESSPRLVRFAYEMCSVETGQRLASGATTHIFCSADLRPSRLPEKHWPLFNVARKRAVSEGSVDVP